MLRPLFPRFGLTSAIAVLIVTLQISACSTEEDLPSATNANLDLAAAKDSNTKPDNYPGSGKGNHHHYGSSKNTAAVISGEDSGNVTEDADPDSDNLLEVGGKLDISDSDAGEAAFTGATINGGYGSLTIDSAGYWNYAGSNSQSAIQSLGAGGKLSDTITVRSIDGTTHNVVIYISGVNDTAFISGASSGSVTEDIDPDADNLLEVDGKLDVFDSDTGEAAFIGATSSGRYGRLTINSNGNWNYSADNYQPVIQNLADGDLLSDSFTVSSIDGTSRIVAVTIIGADEPPAANTPAVISGVDKGSVTEDIDPDADNLLETSGRLTITDADAGEASFVGAASMGIYGSFTIDTVGYWIYAADNRLTAIQDLADGQSLQDTMTVSSADGTKHSVIVTILGADELVINTPAVIGGVDSGSVTEDDDPDEDNLLETAGTLTVVDPDPDEENFISAFKSGTYGSIDIDTLGNWHYAVDNSLTAIQNLTSGQSLTDTITVSSVDGTTHNIAVTILGTDDTTPSVTLSWLAPVEREDNTPLSSSEIAGYRIYYGTTQAQYPSSVDINDGSTTSYTFMGLAAGTYYFVITTYDADGRESMFSAEVPENI